MVQIGTRFQIRFQDEKPVLLPEDLLLEAHGKQWLRLRPTAPSICQIILGNQYQHNASISAAPTLQKWLQARNSMIDKGPTEDNNAQDLFEDQEDTQGSSQSKKAKKRATPDERPETVTIQEGEHRIECLVHGKRPKAMDLMVLMDAQTIEIVINHLRAEAIEAVDHARRAYKKVKRQ